MSLLRRRIFGVGTPESTPSSSREQSPAPVSKADVGADYRIIPVSKLESLKEKSKARVKGTKRRNAWIFGLGGLFGIVLAASLASPNGSLDRLVELAGLRDMNLDSFLDVLPAGLIKDVQDLQVRRSSASPARPDPPGG